MSPVGGIDLCQGNDFCPAASVKWFLEEQDADVVVESLKGEPRMGNDLDDLHLFALGDVSGAVANGPVLRSVLVHHHTVGRTEHRSLADQRTAAPVETSVHKESHLMGHQERRSDRG